MLFLELSQASTANNKLEFDKALQFWKTHYIGATAKEFKDAAVPRPLKRGRYIKIPSRRPVVTYMHWNSGAADHHQAN